MPTLKTTNLVAGFIYYDAKADDARLALSVAKTASNYYGAVVGTYCELIKMHHSESAKIDSAIVRASDGDKTNYREITIKAKCFVNATGVWSDDLRSLDEPTHPHSITPARGIHITLSREKLPCDIAAVIPVKKDKRSIFVIPWGDQTYVGTTDTAYSGPVDNPEVAKEEVEYLLKAVNDATTANLTESDIKSSWAGLRPLLTPTENSEVHHKEPILHKIGAKIADLVGIAVDGQSNGEKTADLSRNHQVIISRSGLITVTGGKLTTYRKMAEDTVDKVVELVGKGSLKSLTKKLPLIGCPSEISKFRFGVSNTSKYLPDNVDAIAWKHLFNRYGTRSDAIFQLFKDDPNNKSPLVKGLPYFRAEAIYAVTNEWALSLEDILSRRTRALLHDAQATKDSAREVAELVAPLLGWDNDRINSEVSKVEALVSSALPDIPDSQRDQDDISKLASVANLGSIRKTNSSTTLKNTKTGARNTIKDESNDN
ncbi:MAG: glycerol-3-phosphate dehydrogenase/oxidase [Acidimicrobiales bacterium]|nr:glycerol-3-phosphate dehydrogenase/oxidase [Acidimicrobiales bacterium]